MFRVLIADDESSVVHFLLESIRWEELELEVASTASTGYEVLELIEEQTFDIAILDIRMPGINGLELCERLKRVNDQIQLIIISGYAEFAYAEKAIRYGVIGYCLKPLEYVQITWNLRKAVQNLKRQRHLSLGEDILEILEAGDGQKIEECLKNMGFAAGRCFVAVSVGERRLEELSGGGISVRLGRGEWGYLMKDDRISRIREGSLESADWQGIGYMEDPVRADEVYSAMEECTARAYQFFVEGERRICGKLDEGRAGKWLDAVRDEIHEGRWDRIVTLLDTISKNGIDDFTVRQSLQLCNLIFSMQIFHDEENDYYMYSIEQLVLEYETLGGMLGELSRLLERALSADESGAPFTNTAFMKLIRYINRNYRENISLSSVADALYMNPNYISQLFKKEAGVTFVHYITQKRLEDAKELLVTSKKTLSDIAIEVGFNDTFYFIRFSYILFCCT